MAKTFCRQRRQNELKDFYLKNRNVADDVMKNIDAPAQKSYSVKEELSFLKQN